MLSYLLLFAFGCSSTIFWCFVFQAIFRIYIQMGGFSVTLSCEIMRMPGSVIGSPCDLGLIVPVCGLGILKAHASWGYEERICQCMESPALCKCCSPGRCHPHLPLRLNLALVISSLTLMGLWSAGRLQRSTSRPRIVTP